MVPVVHHPVGGDEDGEELSGELQHGFVLEDDGSSFYPGSLDPQPVLAVSVVPRRYLNRPNTFFLVI